MRLSSKIVWLVAALAVLFGLVTSILLQDTIERYAEESQHQWSASLVRAIAEGVARETIDGNRLDVRRQLERLVADDDTLVYLFLTDFDGRLFAHTFGKGFPRALLPLLQQTDEHSRRRLHTTDGDILHLAYPLIEGMAARVHLGISQQPQAALIASVRRDTLLTIGLAALPGVFFAMLLGRRISRPLQVLASQVQAYGEGKQNDIPVIEDADPEVAGLAEVFRDTVRARAHAYAVLAEREEHLSRTLDSIGDAVISTDAAGRVTRLNPVAEQLTGWSGEAARGQLLTTVFRIINALTREPAEDPVGKVLADGLVVGLANHTVLIARDGREYQIADSGAPIRNAEGAIIGVILVFRDVTEEYRLQAELAGYRQHLEELVAARSSELARSNAALQRTLEELESFSYSVSHDLRAPLRSIDGFNRILLEDCSPLLDDDCKDYLARIRGASQRMSGLIDAMLQLSRLSRHALAPQRLDLGAAARQVGERLREAEPERTVALEVAADLQVEADPDLLGSLLDNLIGNAWKYTRGVAAARIEVGKTMGAEGAAIYYVRDNGVGFDMRYADRLFAPFQRLHGSEFEGSGIGLATAARIVRAHGGRIWAEAAPGEGATFYFTLAGDRAS